MTRKMQTSGGVFEVNTSRLTALTTGGGVNFGIVTEFTYQAYPQGQVYSGFLIYTPSHLEAIVDAFNGWIHTSDGQNPKTALAIGIAQPPPTFTTTLLISIFYDGDEAEGRRIFKPFFDLNPIVDLTKTRSYVEQVISLM